MALIRPLPEDSAQKKRKVDRWFQIAWPCLVKWTSRRLSGWGEDHVSDAAQAAAEKLYGKILQGKFAESAQRSERGLFAITWKRLVLDWIGENAPRHGTVSVDEKGLRFAEKLEDPDQCPADRRMVEDKEAEFARAWREWPLAPVDRFVLACQTYPDEVTLEDTLEATAADNGLTRPAEETFERLVAWRASGVTGGEWTRQLAFILRGPPGVLDPSQWDPKRAKAARDWLDKRRSRALEALREQLAAED
jgi:hypothetical protein